MATTAIIAGSNVEGNISSCSVQTSSMPKDLFHTRYIGVNSCSGEIIGDYTIFDGSVLVFLPIVLMFAVLIGVGVKMTRI